MSTIKQQYAANEIAATLEYKDNQGNTISDVEIPGITNISISVETEDVTKTFFGNQGWKQTFVTAKQMTVEFEAEFLRNEEAHKHLVSLAMGPARNQNGVLFKLTFPKADQDSTNNASVVLDGAISFGDIMGGGEDDTATLSWTVHVNGAPVYQEEN